MKLKRLGSFCLIFLAVFILSSIVDIIFASPIEIFKNLRIAFGTFIILFISDVIAKRKENK